MTGNRINSIIKKSIALSTLLPVISSCTSDKSPNILLIVVDDLGYADLSCTGLADDVILQILTGWLIQEYDLPRPMPAPQLVVHREEELLPVVIRKDGVHTGMVVRVYTSTNSKPFLRYLKKIITQQDILEKFIMEVTIQIQATEVFH